MVELKLKRINVLKFSYFFALYNLLIGFIIGLISFLASSLIGKLINPAIPLVTSKMGWASIFLIALSSGVFGFITGLIGGLIINLVLKIIKGLNFDLEQEEETTASKQDFPEKNKQLNNPPVKEPQQNIQAPKLPPVPKI